MNKHNREFGHNGQAVPHTADAPHNEGSPESFQGTPMIPSKLYEVDENGFYGVSEELEAVRRSEPDGITMPTEQIRHHASQPDAADQVTSLAKSVARQPQAGLMAAVDHDEGYLESKAKSIDAERSRLEAECLTLPYDIKVRDAQARESMTHLEWQGNLFAMACLAAMALWTATADVTLVHGNLSIVFPAESDEIDFSAVYAAEPGLGGADPTATPQATPLYRDPNFYKSIAIFSTLFVLAAMLDVLKAAPLCSLQPMPRGLRRKARWLFSRQGLIAMVQFGLLASAVAFNLHIGFELDRTASDIDAEPPVSSALTYSLMAIALAFSTYAFVHWTIQVFDHLCGVRWDPNPARLAMEARLKTTELILNSIVSVLTCFKGLRGDQKAFEDRFVEECLSVLAGIQEEQRLAAEFANEAAKQAAAAARMQALQPSAN